jgi:hypothetical protein
MMTRVAARFAGLPSSLRFSGGVGPHPDRVGADARIRWNAAIRARSSTARSLHRSAAVGGQMRNVFLGAVMLSGAVVTGGCDSGLGAPSSVVVQAQVDYNMVIADDRAKFREEDMSYLGSVGPYAVYKITGTKPKLVGPFVQAPSNFGYAMACGATHYFSAQRMTVSPAASLQLRGGKSGISVLVDVPQMPQDQGGCTTPKDTFGNPVPDGGAGGSGGSGGSGGGSVGANPGDGSGGDTGVQQIGLTMNPPPPMGSTVLVRRVALTAAQQHNGSHVEPNICCQDDVCSLQ